MTASSSEAAVATAIGVLTIEHDKQRAFFVHALIALILTLSPPP